MPQPMTLPGQSERAREGTSEHTSERGYRFAKSARSGISRSRASRNFRDMTGRPARKMGLDGSGWNEHACFPLPGVWGEQGHVPLRVDSHTRSKLVRLQKFCVTAMVSSKLRTACHHRPGTNSVSPAQSQRLSHTCVTLAARAAAITHNTHQAAAQSHTP